MAKERGTQQGRATSCNGGEAGRELGSAPPATDVKKHISGHVHSAKRNRPNTPTFACSDHCSVIMHITTRSNPQQWGSSRGDTSFMPTHLWPNSGQCGLCTPFYHQFQSLLSLAHHTQCGIKSGVGCWVNWKREHQICIMPSKVAGSHGRKRGQNVTSVWRDIWRGVCWGRGIQQRRGSILG